MPASDLHTAKSGRKAKSIDRPPPVWSVFGVMPLFDNHRRVVMS
jgi:hypothetical protein